MSETVNIIDSYKYIFDILQGKLTKCNNIEDSRNKVRVYIWTGSEEDLTTCYICDYQGVTKNDQKSIRNIESYQKNVYIKSFLDDLRVSEYRTELKDIVPKIIEKKLIPQDTISRTNEFINQIYENALFTKIIEAHQKKLEEIKNKLDEDFYNPCVDCEVNEEAIIEKISNELTLDKLLYTKISKDDNSKCNIVYIKEIETSIVFRYFPEKESEGIIFVLFNNKEENNQIKKETNIITITKTTSINTTKATNQIFVEESKNPNVHLGNDKTTPSVKLLTEGLINNTGKIEAISGNFNGDNMIMNNTKKEGKEEEEVKQLYSWSEIFEAMKRQIIYTIGLIIYSFNSENKWSKQQIETYKKTITKEDYMKLMETISRFNLYLYNITMKYASTIKECNSIKLVVNGEDNNYLQF